MVISATWNYPTSVRFGAGRIAELAEAVAEAGIARPLFVTDPNVAKLPLTQDALGVLQDAGVPVGVFSDVKTNPVEANIVAGVAAFRGGGHDGVVAFGGGSALDVGKLIAFAAGQTLPISGAGPMRRALLRSLRCPPRPAPARRSVAPPSSSTRRPAPKK
jgi:alcohol dehydrogenase class IV